MYTGPGAQNPCILVLEPKTRGYPDPWMPVDTQTHGKSQMCVYGAMGTHTVARTTATGTLATGTPATGTPAGGSTGWYSVRKVFTRLDRELGLE